MNRIIIAVDAMGGDHGPSVTVAASLKVLSKHPHLQLILVGDQVLVQQELDKRQGYDSSRLRVHHASEQVGMDESPTQALRYKKDSSMRVAINLVKEQQAQACVSAGNTGALMAIAHFVLKTIKGVDRPAIISTMPAYHKDVRLLDLGANVDSSAANLVQFAIMGSILAKALDDIKDPKVYLLNIGQEVIKGNKQVKETAQLLSESKAINYQGYIEGDGIFAGEADVIVCDGFVGNVALKTSEGAAKFMFRLMRDAFKRNFLTGLVALMAKPILKSMVKKVDPSLYNGATFLGIQGVVIKSHGSANELSFASAIGEAIQQVEKDVLHQVSDEIEKLLHLQSTSLGTT